MSARTWDDDKRCGECCNGDRCDDPTHSDRRRCQHCKTAGWAIWAQPGKDDYVRYLTGWGRMSEEDAVKELEKLL